MKSCVALLVLITGSWLHGQSDSTWSQSPSMNLSGFIDVFYVYDFNKPQGASRQPFFYNHNRHNEFNLNLGLLRLDVEHSKYRANLALQAGTYAIDNYAAEPGLLRNIYEARVGISLNKKNNLWLDVGVLPSHIGFESALSMDNPTLTRSILAEASPFFSTGAKLTWTPNEKWEVAGLLMNGWQRIQRVEGNSMMSLGTQLIFRPNSNITLNWSTFVGTEEPDESRRVRHFHDVFGIFSISESFELTAGFDYGYQETDIRSAVHDTWFSPIVIGRFTLSDQWKSAVRIEYFQDESNIVIPTIPDQGFKTLGLSVNFDYSITELFSYRIEGRWLKSSDDILTSETGLTSGNFFLSMSLAARFRQ